MPRVTSKGQVTIPHEIRTILDIHSGDEVSFELETGKVVLKKKASSIENIKQYVGYLKHLNGRDSDHILDEMRGPADDKSE
jgi:AbrB family looped-hinge helix DNA binding protein